MVDLLNDDIANAVLYMLSCSLKGEKVQENFLIEHNSESLLEFCRKHKVSALASLSLNESQKEWLRERMNSIRRTVLFDEERKRILRFLEDNGIWYCLLKGIVIKDLYPEYGIREMSDNDILFDETKAETVNKYMIEIGYDFNDHIESNHDIYHKEPIFNFEMHKALFNEESGKEYVEYYKNVKNRLIKDEDNKFGYHFSDEDFYVYYIVHSIKHFDSSGFGIRTLVDIYLYLKSREAMDWEYIDSELASVNLLEKEKILKSLSIKMFSDFKEELSYDEKRFLDIVLSSGVYGNHRNLTTNRLSQLKETETHYRIKYLCNRLFVSEEILKIYYPFFYRNRWARPFLVLYRVMKGLLFFRKNIATEFRVLMEDAKNKQ